MEKSKEKKKVNITQQKSSVVAEGNSAVSMFSRSSRMSFMAALDMEVIKRLNSRKDLKVYEEFDGVMLEVTPKPVRNEAFVDQFRLLKEHVKRHPLLSESFSMMEIESTPRNQGVRATLGRSIGGLRLSMDDILAGIGSYSMMTESRRSLVTKEFEPTVHTLPFIRVVLRLSQNYLLFEQCSTTAIKDTIEGALVEADNKTYDFLTVGRGKVRRRSEAEAQTDTVLIKSRESNTVRQPTEEHGTYVSFFEMYDTYQEIESPPLDEEVKQESIARQPFGAQCAMIMKLPSFKMAEMILTRCLAGNVHEKGQRRFRNMNPPNASAQQFDIRYSVNTLFMFSQTTSKKDRRAIVDLSFCSTNGDIVAVGYGIYSFSSMHVPETGHVLIWNIKNPQNPERKYIYNVPVVTVEFSPFVSNLLAIGLYDGSVEVRDITHPNAPAIAVSQRATSPSVEPVMAIKWIKQSGSNEAEIDPFLSLSQDGSVTKFRVINSPYLLGFKQMMLDRTEGEPEGLAVRQGESAQSYEANRHPQGLNLTVHPLHTDIYFILTDEGCLLKCSTNYTHQYLEVWKTHDGGVSNMDFSPWSPKVFLTCGNDWAIRIWIEGIFTPLVTLTEDLAPVHCAYWSHTHSTVIIAITRKSVDIWDIRRNLLKPIASTNVITSYNTCGKIARCGRSLGVGTERGSLVMCGFDDMPFPPRFQYDDLEKALFSAIATNPDLVFELKTVGFFGYPNKAFLKPL